MGRRKDCPRRGWLVFLAFKELYSLKNYGIKPENTKINTSIRKTCHSYFPFVAQVKYGNMISSSYFDTEKSQCIQPGAFQ